MKLRIGGVVVASFIYAAAAWAFTADDVKLYKDPDNKQLQVEVKKPTHNPRKDYVKQIEVIVDGKEPVVKQFNFQRGSFQRMVVPVEAVEGIQTVTVVAYPTTGASVQKDFSAKDIAKRNSGVWVMSDDISDDRSN